VTTDVERLVIPKFCACCIDDDESIPFFGTGDTPDDAFNDFMGNGEFEDQCAYWIAAPGDNVEVKIWSVVSVEESDWPADEANPNWQWVLHRLQDTRTVEAV
jgi:hypothetical protein